MQMIGFAFYIAFILFLISPSPRTTLKQSLDVQRFDERDIMFARARYKSGTKAFEDYYKRYPGKKRIDNEIRSLPDLSSPGGKYYDSHKSYRVNLFFSETEHLAGRVDGEKAGQKINITPDSAAKELKSMVHSLGAVDSGIAEVRPEYVYTHVGRGDGKYGDRISLDHPWALVFAVEMRYERVHQAPNVPITLESGEKYLQAAHMAVTIAAYIRSLGYEARAHVDGNYRLILPALGYSAGLGEIGRLGYLIHPVYGARIRLGAVSTKLPLVKDRPYEFGVQDMCRICKKCASNCPAGAISFSDVRNIRGVYKWSTHQESCYRYWRKAGTDCGLCMRVCPYSKPNTLIHYLIRKVVSRSNAARYLAVKADNLFYGHPGHFV